MDFTERYGPWALIAGASTGIGAALSHEAASRGLNVVMMARGEERLRAAADDVADAHGVETRVVVADLADPDIGHVVADATADLEIGTFVHNAAVAVPGWFLDVPIDDDLLSIRVNCDSVVILTKLLGAPMRERGRGAIALVTSMGGTQGAVNFGTYNAAKAYQWVLAESLWAECAEYGIDALTILVGATKSENFLSFQATLDPELCGRADSPDPLDRARNRLINDVGTRRGCPRVVLADHRRTRDLLASRRRVCLSHRVEAVPRRGRQRVDRSAEHLDPQA